MRTIRTTDTGLIVAAALSIGLLLLVVWGCGGCTPDVQVIRYHGSGGIVLAVDGVEVGAEWECGAVPVVTVGGVGVPLGLDGLVEACEVVAPLFFDWLIGVVVDLLR
jgi:hypothetical protein